MEIDMLINMIYSQYLYYSSSRIVQVMDFLEFLHEYCKEKSDTCKKF